MSHQPVIYYAVTQERGENWDPSVTHGIKWPPRPSIAISLDSSNRFSRSNQLRGQSE